MTFLKEFCERECLIGLVVSCSTVDNEVLGLILGSGQKNETNRSISKINQIINNIFVLCFKSFICAQIIRTAKNR